MKTRLCKQHIVIVYGYIHTTAALTNQQAYLSALYGSVHTQFDYNSE